MEASVDQINCIVKTLDMFYKASGQQINKQKSKILFSQNTSQSFQSEISNICGLAPTLNLGIKLCAMDISRRDYSDLIEKVRNKMSSWQVNCLLMAGRVTLASSVLSSIPIYNMQVEKIPKHICLAIEKIQRNFIWGHDDSTRKSHLVSWNMICQPKGVGGLGFPKLSQMN